jgi:membrane protein DedA with SNARE-associated domain
VFGVTHIVVLVALHGVLRDVADEVGRHGYLILFALIAAESFGLPLPGEVSLLVGAYEVQRGAFSLPLVIAVGIAAAVSGDNLAFLIGRLAGRLVVERLMRLVHVPPAYLERMDSYYLRHAGWTVVIARQISPARGLAAFSAGGSRVPWRRFAVFNAVACVVWASAVTLLATLFVTHLDDLADDLSLAGLGALGLAVVVGVVYLWRRVRRGAVHGADDDPRGSDEPPDSG